MVEGYADAHVSRSLLVLAASFPGAIAGAACAITTRARVPERPAER